jgi:DNA-binding HxlR family transcriptional regulator
MEDAGVIIRTVYPQVPPRVDYSLTQAGERLMPIIDALAQWWEDTALQASGAQIDDAKNVERNARLRV